MVLSSFGGKPPEGGGDEGVSSLPASEFPEGEAPFFLPRARRPGRTKRVEGVMDLSVSIRMFSELMRRGTEQAKASGLTFTEYLRRLIMKDLGSSFYPVLPQERYEVFKDLAAVRIFVERMAADSFAFPILSSLYERMEKDIRELQKMVLGVMPPAEASEDSEEEEPPMIWGGGDLLGGGGASVETVGYRGGVLGGEVGARGGGCGGPASGELGEGASSGGSDGGGGGAMIAKIVHGKDFMGAAQYVFGRKGARYLTGTLAGRTVEEIRPEIHLFERVARSLPGVESRIFFHESVSLFPGEFLGDPEWKKSSMITWMCWGLGSLPGLRSGMWTVPTPMCMSWRFGSGRTTRRFGWNGTGRRLRCIWGLSRRNTGFERCRPIECDMRRQPHPLPGSEGGAVGNRWTHRGGWGSPPRWVFFCLLFSGIDFLFGVRRKCLFLTEGKVPFSIFARGDVRSFFVHFCLLSHSRGGDWKNNP